MAKRKQYGEETVVMRVPRSLVPKVKALMDDMRVIESTVVENTPATEQLARYMAYGFNIHMLSLVRRLEQQAIQNDDELFLPQLQAWRESLEEPTSIAEMSHGIIQAIEDCSRK